LARICKRGTKSYAEEMFTVAPMVECYCLCYENSIPCPYTNYVGTAEQRMRILCRLRYAIVEMELSCYGAIGRIRAIRILDERG